MTTVAEYVAELERLAREHPAAPVVDPRGFPLAVTPAECVTMAHRASHAGVRIERLPFVRSPSKGERRRGVTGKVLVTG